MARYLVKLFICLSVFGSSAQELPYHPERVLVKPRVDNIEEMHRVNGSRTLKRFEAIGDIYSLSVPRGISVEQWVTRLKQTGLFYWVHPDYRLFPTAMPNDPLFTLQWALPKIGAPTAWDTVSSAPNVVVAIVDSGIRYSHQDIQPNMWQNPYEIPSNGLDDDGNGYVDDVYGINTLENGVNLVFPPSNTPAGDPIDTRSDGHGTGVASIIAAKGNNSLGVAGASWQGKLMAVKVFDDSHSPWIQDRIEGIDYAIKNGAQIINLSLGGYNGSVFDSEGSRDSLFAARNRGVIVTAGAGNDNLDNDGLTPFFPASSDQDNVLSQQVICSTPPQVGMQG